MKYNKIAIASFVALMGFGSLVQVDAATPTMTSYNNFYITYMTPADVQAAVAYAQAQGVNRFFMWTVDQDAPYSNAQGSASLINAINVKADGTPSGAYVATYFPNYAAYNDQRALPGQSYTIAGSSADLNPKLEASNEFIYAFSETQVPTTTTDNPDFDPNQPVGPNNPLVLPVGANFIATPNSYGALYIYDPWSDLATDDSFCGNTNLPAGTPVDANGYNLICGYAFDNQGKSYDPGVDYNHFGNLEAFAALPKSVVGKSGQPIITSLSIGGYGHNATYEAIFNPVNFGVYTVTSEQATQNFVNSVVQVMNHYNIDGVDLDYENVGMTPAQSQDYLKLVQALDQALPAGKFITIAIISNPEYIAGTENKGAVGFAPGVLAAIAQLPHVKAIDLMTYDFSGTFNFGGPSNPGTTGFLSNTYLPNDENTPAGYNFSIQGAVQAALEAGVPASKIGVGIPAYGRALAALPGPSEDGSYLFSRLDNQVVIPAGDQDVAGCLQNIEQWQDPKSCQGMFSYNYILKNIANATDVRDHQDDSGNQYNGTTIFLPTWNVPAAPVLTIINKNISTGTLAIGSWNTAGYNLQANTSYPPTPFPTWVPSVSSIVGQTNLPVVFTPWSGAVNCGSADFTKNLTITINPGTPITCTVSNS